MWLSYTPGSFANYIEGVGTLKANGGDLGGGSETLIQTFDRQAQSEYGTQEIASSVMARDYKSPSDLVSYAIAENTIGRQPQNGGNGDGFTVGGPMYTLNATGVHGLAQPIGFEANMSQHIPSEGGVYQTLTRRTHASVLIPPSMAVRRLTPVECEFLQGFPRGYTAIPWRNKPVADCPDGPRYKALGNSWAVPVARWIGERIEKVEAILKCVS